MTAHIRSTVDAPHFSKVPYVFSLDAVRVQDVKKGERMAVL